MTARAFDPRDRQGPKAPVTGTPLRPRGSLRRTTTLDSSFPDGPDAPIRLDLRARDLRTGADGTSTVSGEVRVEMRVANPGGVLEVHADPPEPRLARLVGSSPVAGWRRKVADLLDDPAAGGSVLYLVLDALPAWMGLASFGLVDLPRTDGLPAFARARPGRQVDPGSRVDLCAGWQAGGTLLELMAAGRSGTEFARPVAPPLEDPDDPLAWHAVEPLPPYGARRRRRIDLVAGDPLAVDAMFRDTAADAAGHERVLHEYTVRATLDPASLEIVDADALPRVLPYRECPEAATSAARLAGTDVRAMRRFVSRELRGVSTCTHLNELYRTFADLGALAAQLRP